MPNRIEMFRRLERQYFRDRLGTLGLQQLDGMLNEVKPVGRKLDFLVQEMNRVLLPHSMRINRTVI